MAPKGRAKTMRTELNVSFEPEGQAASPEAECPLHLVMEELAQLAVRQHILYLEGECQPRPDLAERLEQWSALHAHIRARICAASRVSPIPPEDLERTLDALLPPPTGIAGLPRQRRLRRALAACARATNCPLGADAGE